MEDKTYNGWSNWATWNMNLWLSNNYGDYIFIENRKREILERNSDYEASDDSGAYVVDKENAELEFIEFLETWFGSYKTPDMKESDLEEVNWQEIAEGWLDE